VLRIKFSASRQFSASKSASSPSAKTLAVTLAKLNEMSTKHKYADRINTLIALADKTIATKQYPNGIGMTTVDRELFNEFRTLALSFISSLYGENHSYYKDFNNKIFRSELSDSERGRGILKAIKTEIDNDWLTSMKGLVSADIFSDFLEMAEHLIDENYKDPAAVMIGSVLEEHLRQLCDKHNIAVTDTKNGKSFPKKADLLNAELTANSVYNKLDQKSITTWLDLRNKAAHGKYTEYNKQQVEIMLQGVTEFISRNQI
jgi:hypothetical protein